MSAFAGPVRSICCDPAGKEQKNAGPHSLTSVRSGVVSEEIAAETKLLLATLYEIVDHGRIGQSGGVSEVIDLPCGDPFQDPPHDLAASGLRKP